jgi:hypothetical protein
MPGVRLRRLTAPTPTLDIGLAYHQRNVPPTAQRLLALLP